MTSCFISSVGVGLEQEAEALVQLGGDEIDQLEHPVAAEIAERRKDFADARAVAEILQDDRILGQHLAAVELQRRDRALGVDGEIIAAVLELLGLEVDALGIVARARSRGAGCAAPGEQAPGE